LKTSLIGKTCSSDCSLFIKDLFKVDESLHEKLGLNLVKTGFTPNPLQKCVTCTGWDHIQSICKLRTLHAQNPTLGSEMRKLTLHFHLFGENFVLHTVG